jgi:predicted transglutaminase-like cysteine proteinase
MDSSPKTQRTARRVGILLGMIMAGWSAGPAQASQSMATGGPASQPIGHYQFCKANPAECTIRTRDPGPQQINGLVWRNIVTVNTLVNGSVRPMNDIDIYGKDEVWAYPNGVGDCEDYVLEKRLELMRNGIPLSDLLITVVRRRDGEGHAVLTVRTDKGDLILDNLTDAIRQWDQTGYVFLKRQSTDYPGRWVTILESQEPPLVATPATEFYVREGNALIRCTEKLTKQAGSIAAATLSCT